MSETAAEFDIRMERTEGYRFTVRFDKDSYQPIIIDEPEPIGNDSAPNAARYLAAAVGNCLSASLMFCVGRHRLDIEALETEVHAEIVRNDRKRLRIGKLTVRIRPTVDADAKGFQRCLDLFEDYCVVTQSVREGIDVDVQVEPRSPT